MRFNEEIQGVLERREIANHKNLIKEIKKESQQSDLYLEPLNRINPNIKLHQSDFSSLKEMLFYQERMDAQIRKREKPVTFDEDGDEIVPQLTEEDKEFIQRGENFDQQARDIVKDMEDLAKTRNMIELCDEIEKAPRNYSLLLTGKPNSRENEREVVRSAREVKEVLNQRLIISENLVSDKLDTMSYMGAEVEDKPVYYRCMYAGNNTADFKDKINDEIALNNGPKTAGQARMNAYCKSMFEQSIGDRFEDKYNNIFIGDKSLYDLSKEFEAAHPKAAPFDTEEKRNQWMMNKMTIAAVEGKEKITACPGSDDPSKKVDIKPVASEFKKVPQSGGLTSRFQDVCDMFMDYGLLKTPFEMIRRGVKAVKSLVQPMSVNDLAKEDKQKSRATDWLDEHVVRPEHEHKKGVLSETPSLKASDMNKQAPRPKRT
jgi:hypothetical protein